MRRIYSPNREDSGHLKVNWNLGNTCSLKCSYCSPALSAGNLSYPELQSAINFVAELTKLEKNKNRITEFSFVGGEPLEWEFLPQLCEEIARGNHLIHVMSNGIAPAEKWGAIKPYLTSLTLTCHSHCNFEHFENTLAIMRNIRLHVLFAMTPHAFDLQLERRAILLSRGVSVELQPLYRDHLTRKMLHSYSDEQMDMLFPHHGGEITTQSGDTEPSASSVNNTIRRGENSFTGMFCGIGLDQLVIDPSGNIWCGWCRVGGKIGNIHAGDFVLPTEPQTCSKATCDNPLDLTVMKWDE